MLLQTLPTWYKRPQTSEIQPWSVCKSTAQCKRPCCNEGSVSAHLPYTEEHQLVVLHMTARYSKWLASHVVNLRQRFCTSVLSMTHALVYASLVVEAMTVSTKTVSFWEDKVLTSHLFSWCTQFCIYTWYHVAGFTSDHACVSVQTVLYTSDTTSLLCWVVCSAPHSP